MNSQECWYFDISSTNNGALFYYFALSNANDFTQDLVLVNIQIDLFVAIDFPIYLEFSKDFRFIDGNHMLKQNANCNMN